MGGCVTIEHEREGERFVDALLSALTVCCLVALGLKGKKLELRHVS